MAQVKRKTGDGAYDDFSEAPYNAYRPDSGAGCGTYFSAAVQYPLVGGTMGKLLIGALLVFIPVIGSWILAGYALRATRNVMAGDYRLPEWDDFAGDFVRGLIVSVGLFIFSILMTLSMIAIVTIPIVIFFSFPLTAYALSRFAATDDFTAFFDIIGAYRALFYRFGDAFMMTLGAFAAAIVYSILIAVGIVLFVVPGLMMSAALMLALAFMTGIYGRTVLNA